jgi:hypothetical protein
MTGVKTEGAEVVAAFRMGDRVPDWLITIDPPKEGGAGALVRFATDCFVLETDRLYHLIPKDGPVVPAFLHAEGQFFAYATTKPVAMSVQASVIWPMQPPPEPREFVWPKTPVPQQ